MAAAPSLMASLAALVALQALIAVKQGGGDAHAAAPGGVAAVAVDVAAEHAHAGGIETPPLTRKLTLQTWGNPPLPPPPGLNVSHYTCK